MRHNRELGFKIKEYRSQKMAENNLMKSFDDNEFPLDLRWERLSGYTKKLRGERMVRHSLALFIERARLKEKENT